MSETKNKGATTQAPTDTQDPRTGKKIFGWAPLGREWEMTGPGFRDLWKGADAGDTVRRLVRWDEVRGAPYAFVVDLELHFGRPVLAEVTLGKRRSRSRAS